MRITLRDKTTSLLSAEAARLNLAPEELVQRIVENHYVEEQRRVSLQTMSYSDLVEMGKSGTAEDKLMASRLRVNFIR